MSPVVPEVEDVDELLAEAEPPELLAADGGDRLVVPVGRGSSDALMAPRRVVGARK